MMKNKYCKDNWWNGFTHETAVISPPDDYPISEVIEETQYAVRKKWFEYTRCYRCGKIFIYSHEGKWQWKDETREIQVG